MFRINFDLGDGVVGTTLPTLVELQRTVAGIS
jgi:hypothetical protein